MKSVVDTDEKHGKQRNGSVEVLRCLLMFMIVLWHNWHYGIYSAQRSGGEVAWWTVIFAGLIIWHVDGFVAISGWFGIKFSIKKWAKIFAQVLFYSGLSLIWLVLCDPGKIPAPMAMLYYWSPNLVDAGWFGSSYLMLMAVAPFVDSAISARQEKGDLKFLFWVVVFGMTCAWAPQHAFAAICPVGWGNTSFLQLLYVYFVCRLK